MKQLRSKKTGRVTVYTEKEYADIVNNKPSLLNRFDVTDIGSRPVIPQTPETPIEIKIKKPKNK